MNSLVAHHPRTYAKNLIPSRSVISVETIFRGKPKVSAESNCPLCNFTGRFIAIYNLDRSKRSYECPKCGSLEHHRLQLLAIKCLGSGRYCNLLSVLHITSKPVYSVAIKNIFESFTEHHSSIRTPDHFRSRFLLPYPDACFDWVILASSGLVNCNARLLSNEILRILKPDGLAIIPGPNDPVNLNEMDIISFARTTFGRVTVFTSNNFSPDFQTVSHEYIPGKGFVPRTSSLLVCHRT